ncbi:fimbrial protein [Pasteurellaceae bacterium Macca]|nr:fimbrial protein [Pasteurellaceae bacterium Macca]
MKAIYQYRWQAKNTLQQKQKGQTLATNSHEVEQQLLQQGYTQIRITRNFSLPQKPKQNAINAFIQQLAQLVEAKIPLKTALSLLLSQCENPLFYRWLHSILKAIESGFSLSLAFLQAEEKTGYQPLSSQELQLVKMGELSGHLALILKNMAHSREKSEKLRQKVKKILFYPLFVLIISLGLSLFLLFTIVPKFAELYHNKEKTLPLLTQTLFNLSEFLQQQFFFISLVCLFIFSIGIMLQRKTAVITRWSYLCLNYLPLLKPIIRQSRLIFFCQYCALMLSAHIPLDRVLHSFLNKKATDQILQREIQHCLQRLRQGHRFFEGLNPAVFSQTMVQMVQVGEQTGNLATMLNYIADSTQQQLDYQIDLFAQLLEPLLMLIMGTIVGTIIVGLYLPIFDLGGVI